MDSEKPDLATAIRELAAEERARRGDDHPEPDVLLAYHRHELSEAEADRVQEHLALCGECVDAVLDFAAFPALEPPEGRRRPGRREIRREWRDFQKAAGEYRAPLWSRWTVPLPVAALFLAAALGLGAWSLIQTQRLSRATAPRGDVLSVALAPASQVSRGSLQTVARPPASFGRVLLSLAVAEPRDFPRYVADLHDANGRPVAQGVPVSRAPPPDEGFSLEIPARDLRLGDYTVKVYGVREGAREAVETYRFRVTAAAP